jgi:hypothetical protein
MDDRNLRKNVGPLNPNDPQNNIGGSGYAPNDRVVMDDRNFRKNAGPRAANDPQNIEGSGYAPGDPVFVDHCGEDETRGVVESIHTAGKKIDVRIDHPGHKEHGRIVTFAPDGVVGRSRNTRMQAERSAINSQNPELARDLTRQQRLDEESSDVASDRQADANAVASAQKRQDVDPRTAGTPAKPVGWPVKPAPAPGYVAGVPVKPVPAVPVAPAPDPSPAPSPSPLDETDEL